MSQTIEIVPTGNKFHVVMNGTTIHKAGNMAAANITVERQKKIHPNLTIVSDGVHVDAATGNAVDYVEEFDINERFQFLETATKMVADCDANALIVVGQGGLGKTWTVKETLAACGLKNYDELVAEKAEDIAAAKDEKDLEGVDLSTVDVPKAGTYKLVTGHSSPKGLYRILWENHGGLIVFDDCDSIQKDMTALNLLKGALDTQGERIIAWASESPIDDGLPRSFKFSGRVIFISNKPMSSWDDAVKSRALTINVHMTKQQIIDRMRHMIALDTFEPNVEMEVKDTVIRVMDENKERIQNLNLRNLIKGIHAYDKNRDERFLTYLMVNSKS